MARYVSCTGKDVVLKFKGTEIIIPQNGYYETTAENLATLFPKHVRKIELNEIIQKIEERLKPINIQEIKPIELKEFIINSPTEVALPPIKEVILKTNITKTLNSIMESSTDPDIKEFLKMIEEIILE